MLLSFRFANHRSFRSEQQLLLMPVDENQDIRSLSALKVLGIFGANASGKSNVLNSLSYMRSLVINSDREVEPGQGLRRDPFRLDPAASLEPSRYVVDIAIRESRYTYGFSVDADRVLEEWLYRHDKKKIIIFERDGEEIDIRPSRLKDTFDAVSQITAPTALFLSVAARFSGRPGIIRVESSSELHEVYSWFYGRIIPVSQNYVMSNRFDWAEDEAQRETVVDLLRAADVGLVDVILKIPDGHQDALFADPTAPIADTVDKRRLRSAGRQSRRPRLLFTHKGAVGEVALDLGDESNGTRTLLDLSIRAVRALTRGGLLLVDEIDGSLHPMLTAKLIGLFRDSATNPHRAQLVFSSHDATLLGLFDGNEVLQRDQIWFTEKDDDGTSSLFPLSDFLPRHEGENRQSRYMNGNYGAVPDLSKDLFEQAILARGLLNESEIREEQREA